MGRVVFNRPEMRRVGLENVRPVIRNTAESVERNAKLVTRVGPYATGTLAASIVTESHENGTKVEARVGSYLTYAASVHSGAEAHVISAHGAGRMRFYWRKVGHSVSFKTVNHPGQRGSYYLTHPLVFAANRYGMRATTYVG